jgi:hypothetical protein
MLTPAIVVRAIIAGTGAAIIHIALVGVTITIAEEIFKRWVIPDEPYQDYY